MTGHLTRHNDTRAVIVQQIGKVYHLQVQGKRGEFIQYKPMTRADLHERFEFFGLCGYTFNRRGE